MPYITFMPSGENIKVSKGKTILDIAFENLIEIYHNCGGVAACTSCLIYIKKGKEYLNQISDDEIYQLKEDNKFSNDARLACRCKIMSDEEVNIIVEIPNQINGSE